MLLPSPIWILESSCVSYLMPAVFSLVISCDPILTFASAPMAFVRLGHLRSSVIQLPLLLPAKKIYFPPPVGPGFVFPAPIRMSMVPSLLKSDRAKFLAAGVLGIAISFGR